MTLPLDRRGFLTRFAMLPIVTGLELSTRRKAPRPPMTVYKSPTCGCCKKWIEHVEKAGFRVTVKDLPDVSGIKRDMGVPAALASCHTALVGAYVIEGHVPADLIDKLLADKPVARGLAVPGMPGSSPGMDVPGSNEHFDVMLFTAEGKSRVYAKR
jgi:hypothetical protein